MMKRRRTFSWLTLRKVIPTVLMIVVLAAFLAGVITLRNPKTLPFHQIKIATDSNHIKIETLKDIASHHIEGGFFSLNVSALRSAFLSLPWVQNVSLRRVWPSELEITIEERQPIARWNENQLITADGEVFSPPAETMPKDLPQLQGPDDSEAIVLKQFQQFNQTLTFLPVKITTLTLSDRHAWSLTLNGHAQVSLGYENVNQRFKELVHLYPQIIGDHTDQVEHIDLRYPNGLAIQWKNGLPE